MAEEDKINSYDSGKCVSIIIPTLNSDRTIGKCLESIRAQTYKNIEIFVIDGFSSDNTINIASRFDVSVHLIEGQRTKAKNFGISISNGEFLLFIDSDMILEPDVIRECVTIGSVNHRIAGVIIPERSIGSGFWVRVRDFERSFYARSRMESPRFFRKKFVIQVGGFDEDIINYEESTLPQKIESLELNVEARISSFILHDEEGFDLHKWLHKKRYYSTSVSSYSDKYMKHTKIRSSIIYRIRIFTLNGNWKRLVRHPILTVGVFILKSLEYLFSLWP